MDATKLTTIPESSFSRSRGEALPPGKSMETWFPTVLATFLNPPQTMVNCLGSR